MGLEFELSAGEQEQQSFGFRFYRKPGLPLAAEENWYDVDARRWAHMSYDGGFYSTLQNGSLALMEDGSGEYTAFRWGRFRLREWSLLENCNGIHSFALEFQIDQDFRANSTALPVSAPVFGWVRYNTNLTMDHSDAFAKWRQDRSRFSAATLQEAETSSQKEMFPRTRNHMSGWECDDQNQVHELFVWLDGSYRAVFRGPRPLYPEGTPYSEQKRGPFRTNSMYPAMGRNRRPQASDYSNTTVEAWAYMEVEGPSGKGPLNTGYWCHGFEGRFVFHELNVYECRFGVAANLALDFEQYCLDENDQRTSDPVVWGSIRVNSTVPLTEDLASIFAGSANVFQQQQKSIAAVQAKQVAVSGPNAESVVVLEADGTPHNVPPTSFQGELLSIEKNITIHLDRLELLAFVEDRMCPRYGSPRQLPCNNGRASGIGFRLYKQEQTSNVTATGKTTSTPKRQKYKVALHAPPGEDSFQEGVWYERVTNVGMDRCQNAHSSIDVSLYGVGATVQPNYQRLVNQGRLIFHELTIPEDCSGVQSFALDLQLHLYRRASTPVFVFLRYNSNVPINHTQILQRHESLDNRDLIVLQSTTLEGWWEDGSSLLDAAEAGEVVAPKSKATDNTTRTVSFGYLENQFNVAGCNDEGIGGFTTMMQPVYGSREDGRIHFASPSANDGWQPIQAHTWYVGSDDYETPAAFGKLSLYGYDCDRRVGVFYVHQLELRDCCAVLGSFAVDLAIHCVEPSVKDPIYGWIRVNTSVPVDQHFIKTLSIQERIDSILGTTSALQPHLDPTIVPFGDGSTTLEVVEPRSETTTYPLASTASLITASPTVPTPTIVMPVAVTSLPSVPPSNGAALLNANSWSASLLACLQMVLVAM